MSTNNNNTEASFYLNHYQYHKMGLLCDKLSSCLVCVFRVRTSGNVDVDVVPRTRSYQCCLIFYHTRQS